MVVRTSNVRDGHLVFKDMKFTTKEGFHEWTQRAVPEYGDVLFTREAPAGETCLVPENLQVCMGQRMVLLRPDRKSLDPPFLSFYLTTDRCRTDILRRSIGSTVLRVNIADIEKLRVACPPLREQQRISQILSTWDKAITTTERLLANAQQQKKGIMQQLLTMKKRFPEFDGGWTDMRIDDCCIVNPKKPTAPENGKVSFITMDSVSEDARLIRTETRLYDDVSKGFTSFIDGDVLIAKITPCFENGKGAFATNLANGIGFGSTEFHVLRAKDSTHSKFIYYVSNTSSFREKGEVNMQGSAGQKRVTTDYLKALKLEIPTRLEEQQKIAAILSVSDDTIKNAEEMLDHLKSEKKALMQQLLTGQRRVKVDAEQAA